MAAPASFDPWIDLDGRWTTDLAEQYLPIPGMPPSKYECLDGQLIVSPYETGPNVYAADELRGILKPAARQAGLHIYTTVNLRFTKRRWIQPDLIVLRNPVPDVWAEAEDAIIVGEFVSRSSRKRDLIDKPARCAEAGIPYYLYGVANLRHQQVSLRLSRLENDGYVPIVKAEAGQLFETSEPFEVSFDPVELLDL